MSKGLLVQVVALSRKVQEDSLRKTDDFSCGKYFGYKWHAYVLCFI